MSESAVPQQPGEAATATGSCCAAIAELRLRAQQSAARRAPDDSGEATATPSTEPARNA